MAPKKQDYASTNSPDDDLIPASLECSYSVDQKFVLYPRRWIVLASFFLLSMSNSWMWITWSPLAEKAARFWDVSIDAVDGLSAVYMYIYVPFSFVSLHLVVHRLGLRGGLLASSILNGIGAIVRCACVASYRWVYLGTVIAALAQTFTLSAPPLLSANWFPDSERATATSIGVLANQLGITIGLGATSFIAFDGGVGASNSIMLDLDELQLYLRIQVIVSVLAFILLFLFVQDHPPTPPSSAMAAKMQSHAVDLPPNKHEATSLLENDRVERHNDDLRRLDYLESIKCVFVNPGNLAFALSFGMGVGVFDTLPVFLSQLLPASWPSQWRGWFGILYQVVGNVSAALSGVVVDWSQKHKLVCMSSLICATIGLTVLTAAEGADFAAAIPFAVLLTGFGLAAWMSIGLEFGSSLTYPADEAAVGGVNQSFAQLFGYLWVTIGSSSASWRSFSGLLTLVTFLALVLLAATRTESRRTEV